MFSLKKRTTRKVSSKEIYPSIPTIYSDVEQCSAWLHVFLNATLIKWFRFNKVVALSKKINHPTQQKISLLSINIYIPSVLSIQDKGDVVAITWRPLLQVTALQGGLWMKSQEKMTHTWSRKHRPTSSGYST